MSLPTHRMRRGKLVEIPDKWRGQVADPQTIRKRQSKLTRKRRNSMSNNWKQHKSKTRWRREQQAPTIEEFE